MENQNLTTRVILDLAFEHAVRLFEEKFPETDDHTFGRMVKSVRCMVYDIQNGYQPGGEKHVPELWEQILGLEGYNEH